MRKFANVLLLDAVVLPPPELDVVELLSPPPPQPAATRARPAAITATGRSTCQWFLRVTYLPPGVCRSREKTSPEWGRRSILPSHFYAKLVEPVLPSELEGRAAARA